MTAASESDTVAFFTEGDHGGWGTALAPIDRRESIRVRKKVQARIHIMGFAEPFDGTTDDLSEGGLRVCVPIDPKLCVGQRCEIMLRQGSESDGEPVYATVVRTERVGDEADRLLGVGVRFDQPLYL